MACYGDSFTFFMAKTLALQLVNCYIYLALEMQNFSLITWKIRSTDTFVVIRSERIFNPGF
jgi:hypothetical protein